MSVFTVITADIIDSRKTSISFGDLEKRLINLNYPEEMITPFKILRGDEIQGVFSGFLKTPQILRRLRYCFYPLQLRIGIGIGTIEKGIDKDNSWEMNGPAFYLARNALDQVKADHDLSLTRINSASQKNTSLKNKPDSLIEKNSKPKHYIGKDISNEGLDLAINTILLLIDTIQRDWTENQWEAVYFYEVMGTYQKAAEKIGIAFQNVEKRCNAANWKQVERAEINIRDIIEMWGY